MEDTQLEKRQDKSNKHVAFVDDEIECCGNLCGHAKFKISAKGCNQFTRMCPLCATKLNAELSGKLLIELKKTLQLIDIHRFFVIQQRCSPKRSDAQQGGSRHNPRR